MVTVYLHGMLGRKFGKVWNLSLNTNSPREALKAIDINKGGKLAEYLSTKARDKKYIVKIGNYSIREDIELYSSVGSQDIHFVPLVKGAKSGLAKILVGVGLIAMMFIPGMQGFALAGVKLTSMLGMMGASLVLGGIVQMLTPVPNFNNSDTTNTSSTLFEGNAASVSQGGSVGLAYGRVLVSPIPVSLSFINEDVSTTSNTTVGSVDTTNLDGGGVQYNSGADETLS